MPVKKNKINTIVAKGLVVLNNLKYEWEICMEINFISTRRSGNRG